MSLISFANYLSPSPTKDVEGLSRNATGAASLEKRGLLGNLIGTKGELERPFIDDVEMKKECIRSVKEFYGNELDMKFAEGNLEERYAIANSFYEKIRSEMGISATLHFVDMPSYRLGGFDNRTNTICLNRTYLEKANCEDLLNTILHESRHAFQSRCVTHPESSTVNGYVVQSWRYNFDHYILSEWDYEAYQNQEVEKDANYYAETVMKKGMNFNYHV